ncbi:monocopper oxidase-like protein SKS1 isoform X2 [Ananas comosus]|uniref:Monocopper oxidase-like protein SKS1 isoform X2 n=1 Tax=Ananas comosus TaxID=4615 RepID=A0A6P5E9A7_ANACO|nr:monocopper oxidase-like protein SKS1 isoform X2 [Ananas comosus]
MAYIEHKGPCTFCTNEKVSKQRNLSEAMGCCLPCIFVICSVLALLATGTGAIDIFLEWNVSFDWNIRPVFMHQPVITINGMFPGPLINSTTNDVIHVNIFNNIDEPLLMTWNGIQQRLNSWQDGVSGTNCPIEPGRNWTYVFQVKDQIGSFFYFLSTKFQKAAGGFGPIRVNNRNVIAVPFPKPEAEFDLLVGDWHNVPYKAVRQIVSSKHFSLIPARYILINGKAPYNNVWGGKYEFLRVENGKTYRLRISNVGNALSFNFRIQDHQMTLVETEGSYTDQIVLDSLDVHVGQSYSVLFTANQQESDYYIVASPTQIDTSNYPNINGLARLHYMKSQAQLSGPLPLGPDQLDREFSIDQARSIRWNMTAGAARPNPQGTFNVRHANISKTFILVGSKAELNNHRCYTVNNVSYMTPSTPLKLADYFVNGSGVYQLDAFPTSSVNQEAALGTSVVTGVHKSWLEIVFKNEIDFMDSWHLDGFGFYVVGFGDGDWTPASRDTYNLLDPVVRSTVQVYPKGWTAVYAYLDNPGMWNLRSQILENWYLGEEMYLRVHDPDPNPAKERPPPDNLLLCGIFGATQAPPFASPPPFAASPAPPFAAPAPFAAPPPQEG